jgi:transposase InsO family protein
LAEYAKQAGPLRAAVHCDAGSEWDVNFGCTGLRRQCRPNIKAWDKGMDHVRGAPYHPQTQGKIERWHQTMKNRVLLENYFLPGDLEQKISAFADHYNNHRYHQSPGNLTPADVYHGRGAKIQKLKEEIKKQTITNRRLQHQSVVA